MSDVEKTTANRVKIMLGGKERVIVFDINAFCDMQDVTGTNPFEDGTIDSFSPKNLRLMLWAAMGYEDPRPSLRDVGSWISIGNTVAINQAVIEAMKQQTPEPKEGTAPVDPPEPAAH